MLLDRRNYRNGAAPLSRRQICVEQRRGKGVALMSGFEAARGDIIVMLDAGGSMDPEEIILFVAALMSGADFVKGSRFIQGAGTIDMAWIRMLGNWGLPAPARSAHSCAEMRRWCARAEQAMTHLTVTSLSRSKMRSVAETVWPPAEELC